jgi:transcriptional regulator with XRE-family HTH domain
MKSPTSPVPRSPPPSQKKAGDADASLGRRIRERREALGLSAEDLSGLLGIARQQVQKYETGENRISAARLLQIGAALGVDVAWFFEELEPAGDRAGGATRAELRARLLAAVDSLDDITSFEALVQIATALATRHSPR